MAKDIIGYVFIIHLMCEDAYNVHAILILQYI